MLNIAYYTLVLTWLILEILLTIKKGGQNKDALKDKGTMKLMWLINPLCLLIAYLLQYASNIDLPGDKPLHLSIGMILILTGIIIRYTSVYQLGQYFCMTVSVSSDHKLIKNGLFRYVRHPSYTGLATSFLGFGITTGNWISLMIAIIPTTALLLYRIKFEEAVLFEAFGKEYKNYSVHIKRLIPFIY